MANVFISGCFDEAGGSPDPLATGIFNAVNFNSIAHWELLNGGTLVELKNALARATHQADVLFWMPEMKPGLEEACGFRDMRKRRHDLMLVYAQSNLADERARRRMVAGGAYARSDLIVEIVSNAETPFAAYAFDPIGNRFMAGETSMGRFAAKLLMRLRQVSGLHRAEALPQLHGPVQTTPFDPDFHSLVGDYRASFQAATIELLKRIQMAESAGTLNFRCMHGFASARQGDTLLVTPADVPTRDGIAHDHYVPVPLNGIRALGYYGARTPAPDTPVQAALYRLFPNMKYALHAHAYIDGAPRANVGSVCGALEEVYAILDFYPDRRVDRIVMNFTGHGSIAMADERSKLAGLTYGPRFDHPEVILGLRTTADDMVQRHRATAPLIMPDGRTPAQRMRF